MRISLIITTFNWKEALELSVRSVFKQTHLPTEIIIADDGSESDTSQLIKSLQRESPIPIVHSWQQNKGFRLSRSRNKALSIAKGDYIILLDGDIVIEGNFIADHMEAARGGYFIQGSRVLLSADSTRKALDQKEVKLCLTDPGVENRKNCIRSNLLSTLFSFSSKRLTGIKTCNFAFWRKHAETVNGFNEDFVGWGREDSEFSARMLNYGIKRKNLKFKAVTYHLYHKINSRKHIELNDKILADTLKNRLIWCKNGLNLHQRKEH
ncbi:MAG: glycosyltransferase family 2 protein [Desulfocapsa sp.]|nr:glycosyltransferase family 2 protein [Desulfocapsa sp.]